MGSTRDGTNGTILCHYAISSKTNIPKFLPSYQSKYVQSYFLASGIDSNQNESGLYIGRDESERILVVSSRNFEKFWKLRQSLARDCTIN